MNRRSFFQAISQAVAIVALAPQLAFGRRLDLPVVERFDLVSFQVLAYRLQQQREKDRTQDQICIFTDRESAESLRRAFKAWRQA